MQGIRCGMAFRSGALRPAVAPRTVAVSRPFVSSTISGLRVGDRMEEAIIDAPSNGMKYTMMRHGNRVKQLGRPADQRKALIRGLVTQTIQYGSITTTKVKAKVARQYVDKMITLAKDGSIHARRQALGFIYDPELVKALFDGAAERYGDRNGGYTRVKPIFKLRRGDATEMAVLELV